MPPITYRNVNAPNFRDSAALLESANNSFNAGFDRFSQIITDRQKLQADQIKQTRDANQSDFRDYLQSFATPEDLAAAKAAGAIDERLAQYGGVIDTNAIRGAADDRLTALRTGANASFEYDKTKESQNDDPILNQIAAIAAERTRGAKSESELVAGVEDLAGQIEAGAFGDLSATGRQKAIDALFGRSDTQENELEREFDRNYKIGRRGIEDKRADDEDARSTATRERATARNDFIQGAFANQGDLSDTELRRVAQEQLIAAGNTPEEVAGSVQALDTLLSSRAQVATSDTARGADAKAQLRAEFRVDQNAFNGSEDVNALESVAAIIEKNSGEGQVFSDSNDDFKLQVAQDVTELLSTGLRIQVPVPGSAQKSKAATGRGGTGNKAPKTTEIIIKNLPPALLEAAMVGVGSKWTELDQSLPEAVTRLFVDNPGLIEDYKNYEKFQEKDLELDSEISRRTTDEQTRQWRNFVRGNAQ